MQVTFTGQTTQITDRERDYTEKKLQKLSRYFRTAREAHVTHQVQRNWQIVEVQLDLDGMILRAQDRAPDFFAAVDSVSDKLDQQVRRFKERIKSHKGRADAPTFAAAVTSLAELEDANGGGAAVALVEAPPGEMPTVVRRKRFAIKPMTVDEAAARMELLNHDFFAFVDADTDDVSILYHRRDGGYGLLQLEA
jgi:putative sigma-54 modulation protein